MKSKKAQMMFYLGMSIIVLIALICITFYIIIPKLSCPTPCQKLNGICFCGWKEFFGNEISQKLNEDSRTISEFREYLDKQCEIINLPGHDPSPYMEIKGEIYIFENQTRDSVIIIGQDAKMWECLGGIFLPSEQEPICLEEGINRSDAFLNLRYRIIEKDVWCTRCLSLAVFEEVNQSRRDNYLSQYYSCKEELNILRQQFKETNYVCVKDSTNLQELWDNNKCEVLEWGCKKKGLKRFDKELCEWWVENKGAEDCLEYIKCKTYLEPITLKCGETEWKRR